MALLGEQRSLACRPQADIPPWTHLGMEFVATQGRYGRGTSPFESTLFRLVLRRLRRAVQQWLVEREGRKFGTGERKTPRRWGYLCRPRRRTVPASPNGLIQASVAEGLCPRLRRTGRHGRSSQVPRQLTPAARAPSVSGASVRQERLRANVLHHHGPRRQ